MEKQITETELSKLREKYQVEIVIEDDEVEKLAAKNRKLPFIDFREDVGFIHGFNQAKQMFGYSEEQMKQALLDYGDFIFNQHKGTFSSSDLEKAKDKIIQSLNQPKYFIEVEEKPKSLSGLQNSDEHHEWKPILTNNILKVWKQ